MPGTTFSFSLGPWRDNHGNQMQVAVIGREVGGNATIVQLHHDFESDGYLYGYWENDVFGKAFVRRLDRQHDDPPVWEVDVAVLRHEGAGFALAQSQHTACVAKIIDALSQWPDFDVRLAVPGKVLRRVVVGPSGSAL